MPLTAVEFRLLAALLEADGRVLTRDQLLDAVYGQDEAEILDRTVDVHIGRLRDKLGDDADRPRYVATVAASATARRRARQRPTSPTMIGRPRRHRGGSRSRRWSWPASRSRSSRSA